MDELPLHEGDHSHAAAEADAADLQEREQQSAQ
jgi:hypothetical protein